MAERRLTAVPADVRDAFFETVYAIASGDRRVIVLTDDQGAFALERFRKDLPAQYVNGGVAEQNLVAVAAGLALAGKLPIVYGIATFVTMRCYEHLRVDLSGLALPVTVVGSGPGYTYGSDGPTHHASNDVAIMRALPGFTILSPADAVATAASAEAAYENVGPTYVRLEKGTFPSLYATDHDFAEGFAVLRRSRSAMLVTTGVMVHTALAVADELGRDGLDVGVVDVYRLKPAGERFLDVLAGAGRVVTLEETSMVGGLGSLVAELVADANLHVPLRRLAAPDALTYDYGPREWLHERFGLNAGAVAKSVAAWLRER